jgi:hypothetical protein
MFGSHLIAAALTTLAPAGVPAQDGPALTVIETSKETILELGPIDIPSRETRAGVWEVPSRRIAVPNGGWLHGYSIELVDRTGAPVPQRVIEHLYVRSPNKRELFSADQLYLAAASGETEPVPLPRVVGYRLKKGDTLRVDAAFRGQAGRRWDGVRVRVHFPRSGVALSVYPFYLTVPAPARPDPTMIPPGRSEAYWEGSPSVRGSIMGLSGHAPPYAVGLRFEDRTSKKVIWEARPDTNAAGESMPVPIKVFYLGAGIRPDHTYRFTVTYHNHTNAPFPASGGWGVLGGVFKLANGAVWPSVDAGR